MRNPALIVRFRLRCVTVEFLLQVVNERVPSDEVWVGLIDARHEKIRWQLKLYWYGSKRM